MRLKYYESGDLKVGDKLVEVKTWTFWGNEFRVSEPKEIVRLTEKTVFFKNTRKLIEDIGKFNHSGFYCPEEDVEELVANYVAQKSELLNTEIDRLKEELNKLSTLTRGAKQA